MGHPALFVAAWWGGDRREILRRCAPLDDGQGRICGALTCAAEPVDLDETEFGQSGCLALRGVVGRASTKPPTPLRSAEWGTLRGDFRAWQGVGG
jgi:hypothetical protein